jgi:hypothetical protein
MVLAETAEDRHGLVAAAVVHAGAGGLAAGQGPPRPSPPLG